MHFNNDKLLLYASRTNETNKNVMRDEKWCRKSSHCAAVKSIFKNNNATTKNYIIHFYTNENWEIRSCILIFFHSLCLSCRLFSFWCRRVISYTHHAIVLWLLRLLFNIWATTTKSHSDNQKRTTNTQYKSSKALPSILFIFAVILLLLFRSL